MTNPTDNDDELNDGAIERDGEVSSGDGKKGKAGSAGGAGGLKFSAAASEEDTDARRKKKGDSGEGDSDSFGRGKAGAGAGMARLSSQKDKEVKDTHRQLLGGDLVEAIVEFFSELPMRASANLAVTWEKTKTNVKSFAIVNWVIEFGEKAVHDLALNRNRDRGAGRDTRTVQRKRPSTAPGVNLNLNAGPTGPTGQ